MTHVSSGIKARRFRRALLAAAIAGAAAVSAGCTAADGPASSASPEPSAPVSTNPLAGRGLYVDPGSRAAAATADAAARGETDDARIFGRIAEQPTAIWLLPESDPIGTVGARVTAAAAAAKERGQTPVFVVYGIPDRDCGNHSSGGLGEADYPVWVAEIAEALDGASAAVVLEPDSLALTDKCANAEERVSEVSTALGLLAANGALVYLDGGHSNWLPAPRMADLLRRAGVANARGFATNVANYNATAREIAYADQVSSLTGDAHYVIDTGRNGNGSDGDWCNPPGRAIGSTPEVFPFERRRDAILWIKAPGESDGVCNGGPPAGQWWDAAARELAGNAGW